MASRHNNPHPNNCQDPPVSCSYAAFMFIHFHHDFQCVLAFFLLCISLHFYLNGLLICQLLGGMLTLAPSLLQSSSLPVEGSLVSEEANHTESSPNTGTQGDTVVGK